MLAQAAETDAYFLPSWPFMVIKGGKTDPENSNEDYSCPGPYSDLGWFLLGVSSTGPRNTPRWSTLTVGAGAISPLRAKTLDTAFVPSSGSGVIRQYWQLFQPSQRVAFSCGMNRVRACPSICMPFQRGGLE